jgi:uncharacterized protein YndB with AHSA1/START domain
MGVKKDASGRRSVQAEVEVPGTPEDVWRAIATGPGVSSWFVPTEIAESKDGVPVRVVSHFGPGMDAVATVTAWDPPRRFAAEGHIGGPDSPPVATEWIVEARSGGTCVVRVVHSLFASSADWDDQLEGIESGWPGFFGILSLYLTHFPGQQCSMFRVMGVALQPETDAWRALTTALDLAGVVLGQQWQAPAGVPSLAGVVERLGKGRHPHALLLRLHEPLPAIASLFAQSMGDRVYLAMTFYLYGDRAPAMVTRDEPFWRQWMNQLFSSIGGAGSGVEQ